jgi:putative (di)nucleoside polyphosphate hydrolase
MKPRKGEPAAVKTDGPARGYRRCVGIMLVNRQGLVFAGSRSDTSPIAWQMPQGGIDPGEDPKAAALRELKEEVGSDKAVIVAESSGWLNYDLPPELLGKLWGGRFRGQTQKWFLARFTGVDADFDLDAHEREFDEWRWMPVDDLPRQIVEFKRIVYEEIVAEFGPLIAGVAGRR